MDYVYHDGKMLRCGYTTGTCAAAASGAAVRMLLSEKTVSDISIVVPSGKQFLLPIEFPSVGDGYAECAVRKDGGDDTDATDNMLIYARVSKIPDGVVIDGGKGIGTVTKKGLDQPVGNRAINSVPRKMITEAVVSECEKYGYKGGISVLIYAPLGEEIAKKTYNPYMGIEGGISIIGTSGIVEPMSVSALLDTIRLELNMKRELGYDSVILTPGNHGVDYISDEMTDLSEKYVKCSNYIGKSIEMSMEMGFGKILLVGHIGKLIKLGSGIMNTHSAEADGRMETLVTCALLADADTDILKSITECVTVDAGLEILEKNGFLSQTMKILTDRIGYHLCKKTRGTAEIGAVVFSNEYGLLGKTENADGIISYLGEM